jgi:hypothetical protein
MAISLTIRDRLALRLPLVPDYLVEEEAPTACEDCGDDLDDRARAGLCPSCVVRRRARYCAGYYAATARSGQVVDEGSVEGFRHLLPAALARRGLRLEREALNWVVRRG